MSTDSTGTQWTYKALRHTPFRSYFISMAFKRLSADEARTDTDEQYEIEITKEMQKGFAGHLKPDTFRAVYMRLDDKTDPLDFYAKAATCDVIHNKPGKPKRGDEWRLIYDINPVTERMFPGDALFLVLTRSRNLLFFVTGEYSSAEEQLFRFFRLHAHEISHVSDDCSHVPEPMTDGDRFYLESLDIVGLGAIPDREPPLERVNELFPSTRELSRMARTSLPQIKARENPDAALYTWVERETSLFKHLEAQFLSKHLQRGFMNDDTADIDGFLQLAKSTFDLRNARKGASLVSHIGAILDAFDLRYVRHYIHKAMTEYGYMPDFLFSSAKVKSSKSPGDIGLTLLDATSTCKDRLEHLLLECAKIPDMYLLTFESNISEDQTKRMRSANISLVAPADLHPMFSDTQRQWLWSLQDFVEMLTDKQK